MPCATCGSGGFSSAAQMAGKTTLSTAGLSTAYTVPQLIEWKNLLLCVKDNNLYDQVSAIVLDVNSALGIIYSAISHEPNMKYFEPYLIKIEPLILRIVNSGLCQ